jgi:hypothetical protein
MHLTVRNLALSASSTQYKVFASQCLFYKKCATAMNMTSNAASP